MQALLKIPFSEKENAKEIAKIHNCRLYWDSSAKLWKFEGECLPPGISKYLVPGSQSSMEPSVSNNFKARGLAQFSFLEKSKMDTLDFPNFDLITKSHSLEPKAKPMQVDMEAEKIKDIPRTPYYHYVVDVPFQQRQDSAGLAGRYNSLFKTYIVTTLSAEHIPPLWRAQPYSYEAWIERHINHGVVCPDIELKIKNLDEITPRDYQVKAKKMALQAYKKNLGGFLIADEVGLGKTISAAIIAQSPEFNTILIITTLSATAHWRKTFLKFNFKDKSVLIINYDRLQKLFKPNEPSLNRPTRARTGGKKNKNKTIAKHYLAPIFDLVIWDESHKLKNSAAIRSKLAMKIQLLAQFNLYLSATAGQTPLELSYLAPLLARITGDKVKNLNDFEAWCKSQNLGVSRGEYGKWSWSRDSAGTHKMHTLLFGGSTPAAVRRTPQDIAGWPEINRILQPYEFTNEERHSYQLSWDEFCENYKKAKQLKPKQANATRQSEHLRFRQKSSLLKVAYTVEQCLELIESGHSVAISVNFKQTLFELEKKLTAQGVKVSLIFGEQGAIEKETSRIKFQEDETEVCIFTVEEAISLHQGEYPKGVRPRSMLIHDLRWSAISMAQIEGRTHRDGKFSQIYWSFFDSSVDNQIAQIVLSRLVSMKTMIGDDTKTLEVIEKYLESLVEQKK